MPSTFNLVNEEPSSGLSFNLIDAPALAAPSSLGEPQAHDFSPPDIAPISQETQVATPLENYEYNRTKELYTGQAFDVQDTDALLKKFQSLGGSLDAKWSDLSEPQQQALLDYQQALRGNEAKNATVADRIAKMQESGMPPEQYRMQERYANEMKNGPDARLMNLPIFRGLETGAEVMASAPAQLFLRATGDQTKADQLARGTQDTLAYHQFVDAKQGKAASYIRQGVDMLEKYTPAGVAGGGPGLLAMVGAETQASKWHEGLQSGMTNGQAAGYAGLHAAKDVLLTWLGGKIAGKLGGRTLEQALGMGGGKSLGPLSEQTFQQFAKRWVAGTFAEAVGEELPQYAGEMLIDSQLRSDYQPREWKQVGRDVADIIAMTAIMQTAMGPMEGGPQTDAAKFANSEAAKAQQAAIDFIDSPNRKNAMKAGLSWLNWSGKEAKADSIVETQRDRERVAEQAKKAVERRIVRRKFHEQLYSVADAGKITREQADYLYELTNARATAAGKEIGDYLAEHGVVIENAKWADFKDAGNRQAVDASQVDSLGHPAYHGSPYKFDKFTTDHMGKGEGAQAYGWGLYFAGEKKVAQFYRDKLASPPVRSELSIGGSTDWATRSDFSEAERRGAAELYAYMYYGPRGKEGAKIAHERLSQTIKNAEDGRIKIDQARLESYKDALHVLRHYSVEFTEPGKQGGALYKVDLKPTEQDYLLWDKPFSEQSEKVQVALKSLGVDPRAPDTSGSTGRYLYKEFGAHKGMTDKQRSQTFANAGIRGIKYLDQLSRDSNEGSHNYVIFDDADIVIEDILAQKNGRLRRNAEIDFTEAGKTVIRAFETANLNSMVHELGHLFRRDLAGTDLDAAARWAGAKKKDGEWGWTRSAEEKFARGFEQYMVTGKAPTKPLQRLYSKLSTWMKGVYQALKKSPPNEGLTPEATAVFDRLFDPQAAQGSQGPVDATQQNPTQNTPQQPEGPPATPQEAVSGDVLGDEMLNDRFRGLANHSEIPAARAANYEVDVALGRPDPRKWAEAETQAVARIQADPQGEMQRVLDKIAEADRTGGTIDLSDMTETAIVNRLKEAASLNIGDPRSRQLHRKLHEAFRRARTEQARSLGYRDPLNTPEQRMRRAVTDAIATPTEKEAGKLDKAKTPADRKAIEDEIERRVQDAIDRLKGLGIDLTDIDTVIADPNKSMIVLDHFRRTNRFSDQLYEYWRNSILSGPRTHVTNIVGNTVFAAYRMGPERLAESLVNAVARNPKSAQLGEFKYMLAGVWPGVQRGVRNAAKAWNLETSSLSEELGREGQFKVEGARGAIPGKVGRLIRAFGYRPLLAADEFAKSITTTMEAGAHAYRAGKSLGHTGEKLAEFINSQVSDLGSPVWDVALEKANEMAFQSDKGVVTQALTAVGNKARKIPGVRWVVPFVQTPSAIIEEGLRMTPILGAALDYAEMRRQGAGLADMNKQATVARQVIALAAAAMLWDAVDDEDGWITGAAQVSNPQSRDAVYRAAPPMSIKIGDNWYSYARIEPFATALAYTVDVVRGARKGPGGASREAIYSPINQIQSKSFLEGLASLQELASDIQNRDESSMAKYVSKFAVSFVPNVYRQLAAANDPGMKENRVWGEESEVLGKVLKRTAQNSQLPGAGPTQRYDLWGRPIQYHNEWSEDATGQVASFVQSLLSPVRTQKVTSLDEVDRALLAYNEQHPEDAIVWSEPQKFVKYEGKNRYLSDEEYAEYAQLAGSIAAAKVSQIRLNPSKPTEAQLTRIQAILTSARKAARGQLMRKWRASWSIPEQ